MSNQKTKFSIYPSLRMILIMCLPFSLYGLHYTTQYYWQLSEQGIFVAILSGLNIVAGIIVISHWLLMRSKYSKK